MIILMIGSAIFGNLCSYAFVEGLSIGASTVAYGLLGAILFLGLEQRKIFMHFVRTLVFPILIFSIFWIIIEPGIDVYGHLGGFFRRLFNRKYFRFAKTVVLYLTYIFSWSNLTYFNHGAF